MMDKTEITPEPGGATERQLYRIMIDAPIEKVWSALVRTDAILPFFFGTRCETPGLAPGAPMAMRSANGKYTGVVGEVIEFSPPSRYVHTFKFTNYEDPVCTMMYDLRDLGGRTELTLTAENVPVGTKTAGQMAQGSVFIGKNLKSLVETGKPTFSGRIILAIIAATGWMSPKQSRSENWRLDDIKRKLAK